MLSMVVRKCLNAVEQCQWLSFGVAWLKCGSIERTLNYHQYHWWSVGKRQNLWIHRQQHRAPSHPFCIGIKEMINFCFIWLNRDKAEGKKKLPADKQSRQHWSPSRFQHFARVSIVQYNRNPNWQQHQIDRNEQIWHPEMWNYAKRKM